MTLTWCGFCHRWVPVVVYPNDPRMPFSPPAQRRSLARHTSRGTLRPCPGSIRPLAYGQPMAPWPGTWAG